MAKVWQDEKFKKRFVAEPATVFKEFGVEVRAGVQLRVVENTDQILYLMLPAKAPTGELTDADLKQVVGGDQRSKPATPKFTLTFSVERFDLKFKE